MDEITSIGKELKTLKENNQKKEEEIQEKLKPIQDEKKLIEAQLGINPDEKKEKLE